MAVKLSEQNRQSNFTSTLPHPASAPERMFVLVADGDAAVRKEACEVCSVKGFASLAVRGVPEARATLGRQKVDVLLLDLKTSSGQGLQLMQEVKVTHPGVAIVIMTAGGTIRSAIEIMQMGASDYLAKPFGPEELVNVLCRLSRSLQFDHQSSQMRERLRTRNGMGTLIGISTEMENVYRIMSKVACSVHPVLILGESGTGKELVARAIHDMGANSTKPFVPVDCGSLVPTLIESELFGHVKGAFTGAVHAKEGLLAAAHGGTVFLDEIGELPLDLQAKLLRALQEKEVRPVGANEAVPICARILAATNCDLEAMMAQGLFRKDLYYRLNVVNILIPPLRDRRGDIEVLAEHLLDKINRELGEAHTLSEDAVELMTEYDWPGNVRELQHAIERACALSSGLVLNMMDMPTALHICRAHRMKTAALEYLRDRTACDSVISIAKAERKVILKTIDHLRGDKLMAAKLLGIGKTTLYRKLKEYGIADRADTSIPPA